MDSIANKKNLDQLIELAKKPLKPKDKSLDKFSSMKRFIISDNVKPGTERIPSALFYDRYKKWCKVYNEPDPLTKMAFSIELKKHFIKKVLTHGTVYLASPEGFDLSPENLSRLKEESNKTTELGNGKKENKKKSHKKEEV